MKRSPEFIAVPLVAGILGVLFLVFIAAVAGLGLWLILGLALLGVLAVVAFAIVRSRRLTPVDRVAQVSVDDDVFRVLVVAAGDCSSSELGDQLARHAEGRETQALVVAPVAASRLATLTGDEGSYDTAREHLEATVAALNSLGVSAQGRVGSHDPLQAAVDGLREFAADEVLFAIAPDGDFLERARRRLPVAVHQVTSR